MVSGLTVNNSQIVSSRDHLHAAKIVEKLRKHFLSIYAVVKSGAPNLDGARDVVIFHETENGVSNRPPKIHRGTETKAGCRFRTQRGPMPRLPLLSLPEKVLLIIIEVRWHEPRVIFAGGCLKGPQIRAIGFSALVERDVSQRGRSLFNDIEQVLQDSHIDGSGLFSLSTNSTVTKSRSLLPTFSRSWVMPSPLRYRRFFVSPV